MAYGTKKYEEALITEPFPILLLYNSIDTEWKTSLDYRVLKDTTTIRIASPSGEELEYKIESGSFTPKTPTQGILSEKNNQLTYTQKHKEVTFKDEEPEKIKHHHSSPIVLERKGNLLTARTKSQEKVEILLDEYGKAKSLETSSTKVDLTYNQNGSLTKRTTNASGFKSEKDYHYENSQNPRLLTGITDENGARYATWTYDDQGRAISSEHANGAEKVTLAYNDDGSTTVTNEYGKQATYRFQVIQGIKRIVAIEGEPSPNCPGSNSTFTYDDQGLLTSKRDNNGNLTTYQYNARGLETSRTEAAGTAQARTITTDWHPTLFLPAGDLAHRGRRHCAGAHHHNRLAPDPVPPGAGQRARPDHPLPVRRRGTQDRRGGYNELESYLSTDAPSHQTMELEDLAFIYSARSSHVET